MILRLLTAAAIGDMAAARPMGTRHQRRAGTAWCPGCGRRWPLDEVEPCPLPGQVRLWDQQVGERVVCRSHAAHPSAARLVAIEEDPPHGTSPRQARRPRPRCGKAFPFAMGTVLGTLVAGQRLAQQVTWTMAMTAPSAWFQAGITFGVGSNSTWQRWRSK